MRQIKFRAWDGFNMSESFELDNKHTTFDDCKTYRTISSEVLGWKVMQYTGLKDKNGKDIYEGDVVRLIRGEGVHTYDMSDPDPDRRIIVFHDEDVAFDFYTMDGKKQRSGLTLCKGNAERGCFEIIGNIYENPELLK